MGSEWRTASGVHERRGTRARLVYWVLLQGDRRVVAGGIVVAVVLLMGGLTSAGVLAVGPDGHAATLFGSGLTSGVLTLVTVALSINQLILSRVFGSPNELTDRLEGTRELRRTVEALAERPSSPTDPATFLALTGSTLADRTAALQAAIEASEWAAPAEVTGALDDIAAYGRSIDDHLEDGVAVLDVLDVVLGPEYAQNMAAVARLRTEYAADHSADVRAEFEAVSDLLDSIAVSRQFFKTLSLQQDFAHLSRLIVYTGLVALLTAVSLTLVYRTNTVTVTAAALPLVVSAGVGVVVSPLAAFTAYILRAATIAHRTVSVGPFVPPEGQ